MQGPAVLLSFVVAGIVCAFAGLCYAELSSTLPVSGSAYTYSYTTLGEFVAWIMGSLLLLEYGLAASVVAVGWSGYVVSLLADFGLVIPPQFTGPAGYTLMKDGAPVLVDGQTVTTLFNLPAFLICAALAAALHRRLGIGQGQQRHRRDQGQRPRRLHRRRRPHRPCQPRRTQRAQLDAVHPENQGEGKFGVDGIMRAASIVFFAYIGFEAVSTAGQEAKNPAKDMPFGIIGSLVVCTVIYMLVAAIMTLLVPYNQLNVPDPVAVVVDNFGATWAWLAKIIKVGAIIGLTSVVLVLMYAQTRIFYTMARDGCCPRCSAASTRACTRPSINTILVGTITAIAAGFFDINVLGDMTSVGTLAAFAIVSLSVIYLRRKAPELPRGFKVPLYPIVPVLGILSCLYLISTVPWDVLRFFMWYMVGGIVLYFVYGMRHSNLQHGEPQDDQPDLPVYPEDGDETVIRP
jgi:APA family basic amino acid/polyamine antiporter